MQIVKLSSNRLRTQFAKILDLEGLCLSGPRFAEPFAILFFFSNHLLGGGFAPGGSACLGRGFQPVGSDRLPLPARSGMRGIRVSFFFCIQKFCIKKSWRSFWKADVLFGKFKLICVDGEFSNKIETKIKSNTLVWVNSRRKLALFWKAGVLFGKFKLKKKPIVKLFWRSFLELRPPRTQPKVGARRKPWTQKTMNADAVLTVTGEHVAWDHWNAPTCFSCTIPAFITRRCPVQNRDRWTSCLGPLECPHLFFL